MLSDKIKKKISIFIFILFVGIILIPATYSQSTLNYSFSGYNIAIKNEMNIFDSKISVNEKIPFLIRVYKDGNIQVQYEKAITKDNADELLFALINTDTRTEKIELIESLGLINQNEANNILQSIRNPFNKLKFKNQNLLSYVINFSEYNTNLDIIKVGMIPFSSAAGLIPFNVFINIIDFIENLPMSEQLIENLSTILFALLIAPFYALQTLISWPIYFSFPFSWIGFGLVVSIETNNHSYAGPGLLCVRAKSFTGICLNMAGVFSFASGFARRVDANGFIFIWKY